MRHSSSIDIDNYYTKFVHLSYFTTVGHFKLSTTTGSFWQDSIIIYMYDAYQRGALYQSFGRVWNV